MKQLRKINLLALFVMLILAIPSRAQTFDDDMKRMREEMKKHIAFNVDYKLFSSDVGTMIQEMKGRYFLWDKMSAYRAEDIELLTNKRYRVSVDHEQKLITINNNYGNADKMMDELMQGFSDSLRKSIYQDTLLASNAQSRKWGIKLKKGNSLLTGMEITVSLPDYHLQEVVYYYSKTFQDIFDDAPDGVSSSSKPVVKISCSSYADLTDADREKFFSELPYVKIEKNGKATLQPSYKNYTLANYYQTKP